MLEGGSFYRSGSAEVRLLGVTTGVALILERVWMDRRRVNAPIMSVACPSLLSGETV